LHEDADLRAYQNADPSSAGLLWLLEPILVEAWSGLWDVEHWAGRWADCDSAVAVERAAIHLNLIRSKLLQQIELRHRQARGISDRLRAEVGINY
jgi:hypothetical protein